MYGVNAKLSKAYFKFYMCHIAKAQDVYIWGNFDILQKHPYEEQRICNKCAKRENGKRTKLENIINERTKKWLQNQQ